VFISYARIDDLPLTPGEKGWVTRFHRTLKNILSMRLGREAKIWRDDKLQGTDVFSSEIVAQFRGSAALMSIVTPRYLNSEWCTREAREFCEAAQQTGGLVIGNKSRVIKVIKTPVDEHEAQALPTHMRNLLGFEFFYRQGRGSTRIGSRLRAGVLPALQSEGRVAGVRYCATPQVIAGHAGAKQADGVA
jgi:hypothetical protein